MCREKVRVTNLNRPSSLSKKLWLTSQANTKRGGRTWKGTGKEHEQSENRALKREC